MSSKKRYAEWRPSDEEIAQTFEIALAHLDIHFNRSKRPLCRIFGNKTDGVVTVVISSGERECKAKAYVSGGGEVFFYVDRIEILVLEGKTLEKPITIKNHNFDEKDAGNHRTTALTHHAEFRDIHVHQILTLYLGSYLGLADSAMTQVHKYPQVIMDGEEFKLVYRLDRSFGIATLVIWYSRTYGYTKAAVNGKKFYRRVDQIWKESEPWKV